MIGLDSRNSSSIPFLSGSERTALDVCSKDISSSRSNLVTIVMGRVGGAGAGYEDGLVDTAERKFG